jgi:prepilin signal peptidase PulO-like enzyme (type II secretory pathway)
METIKIELKWALIFSGMTLLWMLIEKLSGLHSTHIDYHMHLTNLYAIPAIWLMVLALRAKKKIFYSGTITYLQGLKSGLVLSLIIAVLSPLTQWITSYVISPEYFPNVIARSVELGYFKTMAEAEATFNYKSYAVQGAIGALVMGLVTSAIAMLFIRTKSKASN